MTETIKTDNTQALYNALDRIAELEKENRDLKDTLELRVSAYEGINIANAEIRKLEKEKAELLECLRKCSNQFQNMEDDNNWCYQNDFCNANELTKQLLNKYSDGDDD